MYKFIEMTQDEAGRPMALMSDEYGGKARWIVDDHCYVLQLCGLERLTNDSPEQETWRNTPWIFPEALAVLKEMPALPVDVA